MQLHAARLKLSHALPKTSIGLSLIFLEELTALLRFFALLAALKLHRKVRKASAEFANKLRVIHIADFEGILA